MGRMHALIPHLPFACFCFECFKRVSSPHSFKWERYDCPGQHEIGYSENPYVGPAQCAGPIVGPASPVCHDTVCTKRKAQRELAVPTTTPLLSRNPWDTLGPKGVPTSSDFSCARRFAGIIPLLCFGGPSRAKSASRSLRRALLMPWVNAGSRYRRGKRT